MAMVASMRVSFRAAFQIVRASLPLAALALTGSFAHAQDMPKKGEPAPAVTAAGTKLTEKLAGTTLAIDVVSIPGGTLKKPDPFDPTKTVEVEIKPLWMSTTEVTWEVYDVFAFRLDEPESQAAAADATTRPSKPYLPADRGFGHEGYAAISITFNAAKEFCTFMSEKTGRTYRLATRDEWEWAARCGAETDAVDAATLDEFAWHNGNSPEKTQPVAQKKPNAWGLYDMLGNVGEWTVNTDAKGRLCGGNFKTPAADIKPSLAEKQTTEWNKRDPQMPKSKWWLSDGPFAGFRIVCEPATPSPAPAGEQK
jgi:formylglycine-generating enzyme required for sulfatase activity